MRLHQVLGGVNISLLATKYLTAVLADNMSMVRRLGAFNWRSQHEERDHHLQVPKAALLILLSLLLDVFGATTIVVLGAIVVKVLQRCGVLVERRQQFAAKAAGTNYPVRIGIQLQENDLVLHCQQLFGMKLTQYTGSPLRLGEAAVS